MYSKVFFDDGRERIECFISTLADEPREGLLLLDNENWPILFFNSKDGFKDCFNLLSYDPTEARNPRSNAACILDPRLPRASKRETRDSFRRLEQSPSINQGLPGNPHDVR